MWGARPISGRYYPRHFSMRHRRLFRRLEWVDGALSYMMISYLFGLAPIARSIIRPPEIPPRRCANAGRRALRHVRYIDSVPRAVRYLGGPSAGPQGISAPALLPGTHCPHTPNLYEFKRGCARHFQCFQQFGISAYDVSHCSRYGRRTSGTRLILYRLGRMGIPYARLNGGRVRYRPSAI